MKRRTFLVGGLTGASVLLLSACTPPKPLPTTTPSPTATKSPLPQPSAFERTAWSKDPFVRGAQSFLAVGSTPSDRAALSQPIDHKLFMAGEATDTDRPSTVAGAWASGIRVAEQVASEAKLGERIVIVGAGIAGATAARQLIAAGYEVIVLEARNRIGGRIDTVAGDAWPFPVELGAGMVREVAGSSIVGELAALKIETKLVDDTAEVRTSDGAVVKAPDDVDKIVKEAVNWAKDASEDASLQDALNKVGAQAQSGTSGDSGVSEAEWLDHFVRTQVEEQNGADVADLSARFGWDPAEGSERVVVGGYQKLVHSALTGADVRLSSVVTMVSYGKDAIGIRFATGESLQADRLVMTVSLGVLKSDAISFDPELPPAHQKAIKALGMGSIEKVLLRFDEPFWKTDAQVWSVVGGEQGDGSGSDDAVPAITEWINLEPVTGEAVLVGLVADGQAEKLAKLSDDDVKAAAMAALAPFLKS